jgi:hypothetical protein
MTKARIFAGKTTDLDGQPNMTKPGISAGLSYSGVILYRVSGAVGDEA